MAWFNEAWKGAVAVGVDLFDHGSAGSTPPSTDITITVPPSLDVFWENVEDDGADVRLTKADGQTELSFKLASWDYSARTASLAVEAATLEEGDALNVAWLYFKNPDASAPSYPTFDPSTPKVGRIVKGGPGVWSALHEPPEPGATTPRARFAKSSTETRDVWFDFGPSLNRARQATIRGRERDEEVAWIRPACQTGEGPTDTTDTMVEQAATRVCSRAWFRVRVKAGDDGTDYTVRALVGTTAGQVFDARAILQVRDPDET